MIPLGRGSSHLTSRCSTIHQPLSISSLLQAHWTAQWCCGLWSQPCKAVGVLCSAARGESPTLGAAESGLVGAVVTFHGWAVLSGHLPFWGDNFPVSCQLLPIPPTLLHSAWPGEEKRRPTRAEITGSHTWTIGHTHGLPVGLLANIFLISIQLYLIYLNTKTSYTIGQIPMYHIQNCMYHVP